MLLRTNESIALISQLFFVTARVIGIERPDTCTTEETKLTSALSSNQSSALFLSLSITLSLPRVLSSTETEEKFLTGFHFAKLSKTNSTAWKYCSIGPSSFHLNGHILGIHPVENHIYWLKVQSERVNQCGYLCFLCVCSAIGY